MTHPGHTIVGCIVLTVMEAMMPTIQKVLMVLIGIIFLRGGGIILSPITMVIPALFAIDVTILGVPQDSEVEVEIYM
jgi:hypothetical protein